jgi:ABC-type multidrug transport system permease subunit
MKRFLLIWLHEFKLFRTALPIHAVAMLEPAVMYILMTFILVQPTMSMYVTRPTTNEAEALVAAMQEIGSPTNDRAYIDPVLTDLTKPRNVRQVVTVEMRKGVPTAVQRFNLIDANLLKNYRNRLTSAAMLLWNASLGKRAVRVLQYPSLPRDISYKVYFGVAMLPLSVFLAAAMLGGVLTAQEFEFNTVLEYRLAPASAWIVLAARLLRLVLTAMAGAGLMLLFIGLLNNYWPDAVGQVFLILLPLAVMAACVGVCVGLLTRRSLPAFLVALVTSFFGWIVGDAFKPAASIGGWYEALSRLVPNTYTVEWLFPHFYGVEIGSSVACAAILTLEAAGLMALTLVVYQRRIFKQE